MSELNSVAIDLNAWLSNPTLTLDPARIPPSFAHELTLFLTTHGVNHLVELATYSRLPFLYNTPYAGMLTPFEDVFIAQLTFYMQTLHPYLYPEGTRSDYGHLHEHVNEWVGTCYHDALWAITGRADFLQRRWASGLLRWGQVRLVQRVFERLRAGVGRVVARTGGVDEVFVVLVRWRNVLSFFLAEERFRSERLEGLLLRYCDEEGVDEEVAVGVGTSLEAPARRLMPWGVGEGDEKGGYEAGLQRERWEGLRRVCEFYGDDRRAWPKVETWKDCVLCSPK